MTPEQAEMNKLIKRIINVEDYQMQLEDSLSRAKSTVDQLEQELLENQLRLEDLNLEFNDMTGRK